MAAKISCKRVRMQVSAKYGLNVWVLCVQQCLVIIILHLALNAHVQHLWIQPTAQHKWKSFLIEFPFSLSRSSIIIASGYSARDSPTINLIHNNNKLLKFLCTFCRTLGLCDLKCVRFCMAVSATNIRKGDCVLWTYTIRIEVPYTIHIFELHWVGEWVFYGRLSITGVRVPHTMYRVKYDIILLGDERAPLTTQTPIYYSIFNGFVRFVCDGFLPLLLFYPAIHLDISAHSMPSTSHYIGHAKSIFRIAALGKSLRTARAVWGCVCVQCHAAHTTHEIVTKHFRRCWKSISAIVLMCSEWARKWLNGMAVKVFYVNCKGRRTTFIPLRSDFGAV